MAKKSKQDQPGQKASSTARLVSRSNEFDDAVTTDIPDDLENAFDERETRDPGDLFITDVSLTENVDLEADDILPAGTLLRDRFEIVEPVYAAGMSYVYKAIDRRRRVDSSSVLHVAIKTMRPSIGSNDQCRLALEREAAQTQSLKHPNIIEIFELDEHDGQFFLVMEWLEGESVNAMLRRTYGEAIDAELAGAVISLAATGLQHAHRNGVIHADINPSNIFITDTREIKLLDFGVARSVAAAEQSEDDRFTWVTQTYASPEVLSGLPPVVEDDVFSLACVVYRLLSGVHPFGGSPSLVAKLKGRSIEAIPGLPAGKWEILRRALSFERADRPSDVSDFVAWSHADSGTDEATVGSARRVISTPWVWPAAAATAIVVLGGIYWLMPSSSVDENVTPVVPAPAEKSAVTDPAISASDALVIAATQSLDEGRLITPDEVSARALFRAALVLESDNAEALSGLRAISDEFVQEAIAALNRDEPAAAIAALTVASETDSANPSIGIVEQLLTTKGNAELAEARLAITTGDLDIAVQKVARAEQYNHIEPTTIQALRQQIEERRAERAAAVTADTDVTQTAEPEPEVVDQQTAGATDVSDSSGELPQPAADEQVAETPLQATATAAPVPEDAAPESSSEALAAPIDTAVRRYSLRELGIRDYTPPEFPRRALRRNISGMVEARFVINPQGGTESIEIVDSEPGELFDQAAIKAINQWRFKAREEAFEAQVVLRFEHE